MGPLLAAFQLTKLKWEWPFWIYTIETGLCMTGIILFVDETYYNRKISRSEQPPRQSRILRLVGIEQWRSRKQRNTFLQAVLRPIRVVMKPTVFISVVYFLFTFAWVVGINTTLSIFLTPLYSFGLKQIGQSKFHLSICMRVNIPDPSQDSSTSPPSQLQSLVKSLGSGCMISTRDITYAATMAFSSPKSASA